MASAERHKFEYDSESDLVDDYKKLVLSNPTNLNTATEYLFDTLVEEVVMGVAFQMHFENKLAVSFERIFIQVSMIAKFYLTISSIQSGCLRNECTKPWRLKEKLIVIAQWLQRRK